jgi:hypothetical protein
VTRAGCIALVCAVVLVAGCGSASTTPVKTLSHGRFVFLAKRVCARAHRQAAAIGHPANLETFTRDLRKAIPRLGNQVSRLRALTPPAEDSAAFQRLLADLDAAGFAGLHLLDSLQAHQTRRAKTLLRNLGRLDKRLNRHSRNLGLGACAKGPAARLPAAAPPATKPVATNNRKNGSEFTLPDGQKFRIVVTPTTTTIVPVK